MSKEKQLTAEQIERKEVLRSRLFWIIVGLDVALVVYIVIQIALLMK